MFGTPRDREGAGHSKSGAACLISNIQIIIMHSSLFHQDLQSSPSIVLHERDGPSSLLQKKDYIFVLPEGNKGCNDLRRHIHLPHTFGIPWPRTRSMRSRPLSKRCYRPTHQIQIITKPSPLFHHYPRSSPSIVAHE